MAQPFDANKLTSDLKQMLKLSETSAQNDKSPTPSNITTDNLSKRSDNKRRKKNTKSPIDPQSSTPASPGNHHHPSSASALNSSPSKSNTEKTRKKKQRSEKQAVKGQEKTMSTAPPSRQSDIDTTKPKSNSSHGTNSPVIVLPSKNRHMGNSDSSKSLPQQGPNVSHHRPENNGNNNAGVTKNQYDDLNRETQIKMDENKIFFLKKRNMRFPNAKYYCRYCDYHMDTIEICEKHMEEAKHRHKKEVGSMDSTLHRLPLPTLEHIDAVTNAIDLMYEEHGIQPKDRDIRRAIVQRLEDTIQKDIPSVRLYMYGSSLTCMGLKTSDINVNLASSMKDEKLTTLLRELYTLLKDRTDTGFINVHSDFAAVVPVLLMSDSETGYKLNIAIHVYTSLCTSELLSIYSDFDERTIKLAAAFRYWANVCGVDKHSIGFIPPIALNIMVIFFLQTVKPSVLPIICAPGVCGEDTQDFAKDKPVFQLKRNKVMARKADLNKAMSVGELWVLLLKFYTIELDIPDVVISIRTSSPISRRHKPWNSRKLAVEEPYMMKNLTRMLTRSYEYWQYTIRKAYHYFGLPRNPNGISCLPQYNFPDEIEDSNVSQSGKSTNKELIPKQQKENCTDNGSSDSAQTFSGKIDPVKDGALNLSLSKQTLDSSELGNDSLVGNVETSAKTTKVETTDSDKSPSYIDSVTKVNDSTHSFLLNYVNSIVEKALDLVIKEIPSSPQLQTLSSASPNDPQQKDTGVGATKGDNKSGEKTYSKMIPIPTQTDSALLFEFKKEYFSNKREPEMVCVICEKEGHHKNECPEDVLPEILPIQGFTDHHHKVLEETLKKMPSEVGLSDASLTDRQMFLKSLEDFIQVGFPGARLQLFGSSCNGFGFDCSDMDICMTFLKKRPNIDKVYAVERLANILVVHKALKNVQAIPTAKVPIVKFTIRDIELDGDISLYNTLAQENTHLLHSYSKIDSRVQVLGYTIKMFAKVCDIGDASRGSLSSYGYILMMLYYLQQVQPPVIPVLQELHSYKTKPKKIVECWDAWFMDDLSRLPELWPEMGKNKMSAAELWLGFLRFYVEEFNHREFVISIRQKEPLTRFDKLWNGYCLAIEDPFDLNHNLGSALTRTMNNFILKTFINGRMLYGSPIDDNMELFNKYRTPSDYFFEHEILSEARPPTLRGCRHCGKIGHLMRHCPIYKKEKDNEQQQNRSAQEKQMQSHNLQLQSLQSLNQLLQQRNSNAKDQQQRQQFQQQFQRQHGNPQLQQRYQQSAGNRADNRGHYSPKQESHSDQRQTRAQQRQQQQNNSYPPQQQKVQETPQFQKQPERDGHSSDRLHGPDLMKDTRPAGPPGQGHYNTNAGINLVNHPLFRPTTMSPSMNQGQPMPDLRNIPPFQYPPSLRPQGARGIINNNQFPAYGINPPPGLAPPFHFNVNNSNNLNSAGRVINNSSINPGTMRGDSRAAMIPQNYMNRPAGPQGHGNPGGNPALLPFPSASHASIQGMSPVVQNLFASTQGKVLDARTMNSHAMKKH